MALIRIEDLVEDPAVLAKMQISIMALEGELNERYGDRLGCVLFQMCDLMQGIKQLAKVVRDEGIAHDLAKQMISIWTTLRYGPATGHPSERARHFVEQCTHELMNAVMAHEVIMQPLLDSLDLTKVVEILLVRAVKRRKKGDENDPDGQAGYLNLW